MRIVLTGTSGLLGAALLKRLCENPEQITDTNLEVLALSRTPLTHHPLRARIASRVSIIFTPSLDTIEALPAEVTRAPLDAIIHCGALSSPMACHHNPHEAQRSNAESARTMASLASLTGAHLVYVSTDLIFEGAEEVHIPLTEDAPPSPLSVYARSKYDGEIHTLALGSRGAVVRVPLLLGRSPSSSGGSLSWMIETLTRGDKLLSFSDEFRTPLSVDDAVTLLTQASKLRLSGVWHASAGERLSRYQLALLVAEIWGKSPTLVVPSNRGDMQSPVPRPRDVSLANAALLKATGVQPATIRDSLISIRERESAL